MPIIIYRRNRSFIDIGIEFNNDAGAIQGFSYWLDYFILKGEYVSSSSSSGKSSSSSSGLSSSSSSKSSSSSSSSSRSSSSSSATIPWYRPVSYNLDPVNPCNYISGDVYSLHAGDSNPLVLQDGGYPIVCDIVFNNVSAGTYALKTSFSYTEETNPLEIHIYNYNLTQWDLLSGGYVNCSDSYTIYLPVPLTNYVNSGEFKLRFVQ